MAEKIFLAVSNPPTVFVMLAPYLPFIVLALLSIAFAFNFSSSIREFWLTLLTVCTINLSLAYLGVSTAIVIGANALLVAASFLVVPERMKKILRIKRIVEWLKRLKQGNNEDPKIEE